MPACCAECKHFAPDLRPSLRVTAIHDGTTLALPILDGSCDRSQHYDTKAFIAGVNRDFYCSMFQNRREGP